MRMKFPREYIDAMGEESLILAHDTNEDAVGMSMRATNAVAAIARKPADLRQRSDQADRGQSKSKDGVHKEDGTAE